MIKDIMERKYCRKKKLKRGITLSQKAKAELEKHHISYKLPIREPPLKSKFLVILMGHIIEPNQLN